MRHLIRPFIVFSLLVAAACAGTPTTPVGAKDLPLQIRSWSLPLKIDDPHVQTVGRLKWRGGIAMTANSANFGGWSDLHVDPDGKRLTSLSDEGSWFTATIDYDKAGNLVGLTGLKIGSIRGLDGQPLSDKQWADSEGLALMPDGSWIVSFERHHRIWRYATLDATPTAINTPDDFGRQPENGGVETLTALADGRIIAISEEYSVKPGFNVGWIGTPGPGGRYRWDHFDYATIPGYSPTAMRRLPDGSFVTLERAWDPVRGVRCRVMRFAASQLKPEGTVRPEELARLASPYVVDNLEGISATLGARGETLIWLISDDNFNPLQRNILLLFELEK
ncbi:MAG TPA: esterase-like activity of phytase family protein [Reyranella sp.]|nr:esterase-like activity of phytase family protein [Reyranella sp.]